MGYDLIYFILKITMSGYVEQITWSMKAEMS